METGLETDLDIEQEAFPGMHAEMCLKDRERFDVELEELRETDVDHVKRIEELERTVNVLAAMVNWDKVTVR
jgi:hypothetical protein